jgi:hypothetical protein
MAAHPLGLMPTAHSLIASGLVLYLVVFWVVRLVGLSIAYQLDSTHLEAFAAHRGLTLNAKAQQQEPLADHLVLVLTHRDTLRTARRKLAGHLVDTMAAR